MILEFCWSTKKSINNIKTIQVHSKYLGNIYVINGNKRDQDLNRKYK